MEKWIEGQSEGNRERRPKPLPLSTVVPLLPFSPLAPGSPAGPGGPLGPVSPFSPGNPVKGKKSFGNF